MIYVAMNELEMLAELCVYLKKNGAAFNVHLRGNQWEVEVTGY